VSTFTTISYRRNYSEKLDLSKKHFNTKVIHAGARPDPSTGAVVTPISLATTFKQKSPGVHQGYEYSRTGNPTRAAFEEAIGILENGNWGLAFASGMAATTSIIHLLSVNDEVISIDDVYGGTYRYFSKIAEPRGIKLKTIDFTVPGVLESSISNATKLIWIETPTNPGLKIVDIQESVRVAKKKNKDILVVVDNTFATPVFQKPLDFGADLVVHSVTKYLNGHCDVVMGAIAGRDPELLTRLKFIQNGLGGIPGPFDSYLAARGLKTLHLRMERQEKNAHQVAQFLSKSDQVEKVLFPGLPNHPHHALAKKQMSGYSGIVTFWLKGGIAESRKFLENLQIFSLAESLGGVESLANHPAIMTHASVPPENRKKLGIHDNMIRLSCGIEHHEDLINDLRNALSHVK